MRHLLILFVLIFSTSSLTAETFYEKFKNLESEVGVVKQDVNELKGKLGAEGYVPPKQSSVSNSKLDEIESAIEAIKAEQKRLYKKLSNVSVSSSKSSSSTNIIAVQNNSTIKDEDEDYDSSDEEDEEGDDEGDDEDEEDEEDDEDETEERLEEIEEQLTEIRRNTHGNHVKMNIDLRTAVDNLSYTMIDGTNYTNDAIFTNRLWMDFKYAANVNSSFTGQLAYYKAYGQRRGVDQRSGSLNNLSGFDWVTNTVANDDTVRVKKAYWFYRNDTFLTTPIPWTFSLGRRPSTNGHLINLRDDDTQSSPLAHFVNVEFDGGSSKFDLSEVTGISGLYTKFCFGRGLTNAAEKFSGTPYANNESDIDPIDMVGLIISLYDDGQYSLITQTVRATNLIDVDIDMNTSSSMFGTMASDFYTTGDINNFTVQFEIEGIGDEWSDFLDETIFFASYSMTQSDPDNGQTMFGSEDQEIGTSYWIGIQVPGFSEKGKFGIEYNHGDEFWRSITFAEDTMLGSKISTRGDAYEAYWTEYFDDALSMQIRYTYIDYSHTGSNGFFGGTAMGGGTGTPFTMDEAEAFGLASAVVDTAQDIRFYLRYKY